MPGTYICENCHNADASKIVLKDGGRTFYCCVCRHLNKVPVDPNELTGTIRIDNNELENAIKNTNAQISLGNYQSAVRQMTSITEKYGYAPEAWYYLSRAETKDFTEEDELGKKHLDDAKRLCESDPSQSQTQSLISAAERKLGKLPEVKKYKDKIEGLEAEIRLLESGSQSLSTRISQNEAYLNDLKKEAVSDSSPGVEGQLLRNRLRRVIQAVFAVGLFILLPWTRDLWNKYLPEQFHITFFQDLAENNRTALDKHIPDNMALFLGIGFAVLCVLLLFFALRSKKAVYLKEQKEKSANLRKDASSKAADVEKTLQETRRELESKKRMIQEKRRLIEEQKQNIEEIMAQP